LVVKEIQKPPFAIATLQQQIYSHFSNQTVHGFTDGFTSLEILNTEQKAYHHLALSARPSARIKVYYQNT
jgi:hypothetical protein